MTKITSYIEKMREIERAATEGPWEITRLWRKGQETESSAFITKTWGWGEQDSVFIATARNELPKLLDALEAALKHVSHDGFYCAVCDDYGPNNCEMLAQIESILTKQEDKK